MYFCVSFQSVPPYSSGQEGTSQPFLVFDYADKYDEATDNLLEWINSGQLKVLKDELDGLEKAPQGFVDLLAGGNIGTRIVNI